MYRRISKCIATWCTVLRERELPFFTRCGVTNFRRRAELLKIKHGPFAVAAVIVLLYISRGLAAVGKHSGVLIRPSMVQLNPGSSFAASKQLIACIILAPEEAKQKWQDKNGKLFIPWYMRISKCTGAFLNVSLRELRASNCIILAPENKNGKLFIHAH